MSRTLRHLLLNGTVMHRSCRSYWTSRPPSTSRIARRIWDFLRILGDEPHDLWHNNNGICFGHAMSDADYGAWKRDGGYQGSGEDVDEYIVIMAGAKMSGLKMKDWYTKFNPAIWPHYQKQIDAFKQGHPEVKTYEQ